MKSHLQILADLLTQNDWDTLFEHYKHSSDIENISQLAFLYLQGQKSIEKFEYYQQVATRCIKNKGLPSNLIGEFKNTDMLSFFTPALKYQENFIQTNELQRNPLHYLLLGKKRVVVKDSLPSDKPLENKPSFNYLRSMMLFESNDIISKALCQRDKNNLTAVELYLAANTNLGKLPTHELTALLALIEIEQKHQDVNNVNYSLVTRKIREVCSHQRQLVSNALERLVLIATYYNKPIDTVVNDINYP